MEQHEQPVIKQKYLVKAGVKLTQSGLWIKPGKVIELTAEEYEQLKAQVELMPTAAKTKAEAEAKEKARLVAEEKIAALQAQVAEK